LTQRLCALTEGTGGRLPGPLRATLELSRADVYCWVQSECAAADAAVGRALALLSQESGGATIERALAQARALQGQIAARSGDQQRAEASYRAVLALLERQGDQAGMARVWNELGNVLNNQGKLAQAEQSCRRALALAEPIGDQRAMAVSWHNLSRAAQWRGALRQAEDDAHKGHALSERIGHRQGVHWAWANWGGWPCGAGTFTRPSAVFGAPCL
jgi:tetratricopeptide (TPR) repeat protein